MKKLLSIAMFFALAFTVQANYLRVTNVSYDLATQNVDFDLTWSNSWRVDSMGAPFNWDAAWVFVKWRECDAFATDPWTHGIINVNLAANSFGNLQPVLSDSAGTVGISAAPDNLGVMLRHQTNQITPSFPNQAITLNVTNLPAMGDLDLRVMGIEMVFVTQGQFMINSSTVIDTQNTVRPNGYKSFHCMKYEISQQQYAEFLNTVPSTYAATRYYTSINNRYVLRNTGTPPNQYFSDRPDRACNYLSWQDVQAYMDWAALRPMDQDEYIKACRGSGPFVVNEYAWGTTNITQALQFATLIEDGTETISTPNANCHYINNAIIGGDGGYGPLRVGIFATPTTTTREQTGATYFGIMEMSGNVWETGIHHSYDPNGFDGSWGNGYLNASAEADVATWPLNVRSANLGGSYQDGTNVLRVNYITTRYWTYRYAYDGGRGVR